MYSLNLIKKNICGGKTIKLKYKTHSYRETIDKVEILTVKKDALFVGFYRVRQKYIPCISPRSNFHTIRH